MLDSGRSIDWQFMEVSEDFYIVLTSVASTYEHWD